MPKSAKKRKDKAADFSKAKLKLGKGKQLPSNAIDTSFKARSIALPSQSITIDKDVSAPTTKRRLTFDDLTAHLKHYNAGTRKDAIAGLRELLDAHQALLETSLTPLINATVRLVGDEDAGVRRSLLDFFAWLFPRIPKDDIAPHASALLLFTTSAQTHIFPEIRVDAIRFLNLYLEHIPAAVVAGWNEKGSEHGSRVLEGYLGILSAGTKFGESEGPIKATSTASVVLTSSSKLVVLQSLSTFLRYAASPRGCSHSSQEAEYASFIDTWYMASWFRTRQAYTVFDGLLQPRQTENSSHRHAHKIWEAEVNDVQLNDQPPTHYPLVDAFSTPWTFEQLSDMTSDAHRSPNEGNTAFIIHLARTLHSTLISTFLDCAPSVFSPNGTVDETQTKLIVAGAEIASHLYGSILRSEKDSPSWSAAYVDLKSMLGYMAPYFPFRLVGSRELKVEQLFQALNLTFCELTSLLVLTSESAAQHRNKSSTAGDSKYNIQLQVERVSEYVVQLLKGESGSASQLSRPLTATAYAALLPTIWALVNNSNPNLRTSSSEVLRATLDHASRASSKSATKQTTIEFVARLVLLSTEHQFTGHLAADDEITQSVTEWINHLPKCLWELGSSNLTTTEMIFRFLIILCQRRARLSNPQTVSQLRSQLALYFTFTHATRGRIPGPYSKIPSSSGVRRLALDLAALTGDDQSLWSAVDLATSGTEDALYWKNIRTP
ncbi:testis-expressed sequence 10 protein [Favolaschia claudopus]|uniref:Pre-rRNA-processing protein n=1 Tax=Favolaschia claudopus TaxID=2862362 RepID=A0AAW0EIH2_9AGAR